MFIITENTSPQKHSTPAKKIVVNGDVPHIQSKASSLPIANGIGCRGNPKQEIGNGSTQLDNMNNSSSSISVSLTSSTNDMAAYTIAVHRKMVLIIIIITLFLHIYNIHVVAQQQ